MSLHLEIVTPEEKIFSGDVENVYFPGTDGEMGVLEMHVALVTGDAFGAPGYVRLSFATSMEVIEAGLDALEKFTIVQKLAIDSTDSVVLSVLV